MPLTQTSVDEGSWVEYGPLQRSRTLITPLSSKLLKLIQVTVIEKTASFIIWLKLLMLMDSHWLALQMPTRVNVSLHALSSQIDMTMKDTLVLQ